MRATSSTRLRAFSTSMRETVLPDASERASILQAGRDYAQRRGIPLELAFQYGLVWVNWLTGDWPAARALWQRVSAGWSEDAPAIYPGAGPIDAAIELEILGPETARQRLLRAAAPIRASETWRGQLAAAGHEANLWLAEDRPDKVLESIGPILSRRPPGALDMESFAMTTRVALPAALAAGDRRLPTLWTDDPEVEAGGAYHRAAVEHARAVIALLDGDTGRADGMFAAAAASFLRRGWRLVAHELAWQRKACGTPGAVEAIDAAIAFYKDVGAGWRLHWLEGR